MNINVNNDSFASAKYSQNNFKAKIKFDEPCELLMHNKDQGILKKAKNHFTTVSKIIVCGVYILKKIIKIRNSVKLPN